MSLVFPNTTSIFPHNNITDNESGYYGTICPTPSQAFLEKFIRLYQSEPCLWNVKSPVYHNRQMKEQAYRRLVEHLKLLQPNASKEIVKRKINSIRTSYRKERRKVRECFKEGKEHDPRLWCYDLLRFLDDASQPAYKNEDDIEDSINTEIHLMDEVSQNIVQDTKIEPSDTYATSTWNENSEEMTERTSSPIPAPYYCSVNERSGGHTEEFSEEFKQNSLSNEDISVEDENVNGSHLQDDRFDAFAKIVAIKLRCLPKRQMLIAEKLINDTLFEGELGNLTLYHRLVG